MSDASLILDGLKMMVLGMGWVLLFLVVMIYLMKLMSAALAPFTAREAEREAAAKAGAKAQAAAKQLRAASGDDAVLAAVAAAAVARETAR